MDLVEYEAGGRKWGGNETFTVPAGKLLRIETTPAGEELLNVEVPAGKVWTVGIVVSIQETDA